MKEISQVAALAETFTQANETHNDTVVYEVAFHCVPSLDEGGAALTADTIRKHIATVGGSVITEQAPQRTRLAYQVERADAGKREKFNDSYFGVIKFDVPERASVTNITEYMRGMRDIFRFIVVETTREDAPVRRTTLSSDRASGEVTSKPVAAEPREIPSTEDLDKSIDALVA